ncbi:TPA: 3-isopropylmalate dehydratase small subunit [Salmonella enterica subsp. enterica serovar Choleraesuis]|uniref:3-isopropylmalate dehydratase small subunit n=1 Tax=Salmonella enterica TaxID=28901 RepID=A0A744LRT5_SALER|nr:3-isopropylmalate dehydratase small subunit [Salmonella enterica]HDI5809724.1 3-isopropylmalate dehydratase small subunit [Salmonella enterica subsp. enterica serovar Choleraesuis]
MDTFKQISGRIAPMLEPNIDTDVIMPKQFLKGIDRQGLDKGVFFDRRFMAGGQPNPDFILNMPGWQSATFLLVGPNFGCGSSREHAVWGLKQLGVRGLIGSTFAGIFDDNCQRNGILTVSLDKPALARLAQLAASADTNSITVSLDRCEITTAEETISFVISELKRAMLAVGEDAIAWTLQYLPEIENFEVAHYSRRPWLKRPASPLG